MALTVRCLSCGLNQYLRETCRRCRKPMTPEEVRAIQPPEPDPGPDLEPAEYSIGYRLLALRKFRGLSQRQVAKRMRTSRSYISKHETGGIPRGPCLEQLCRIADALQVPVFALIEPDEPTAFASLMTPVQMAEVVAWCSTRPPKVTE
jgi:hypothetical protein